MPSRTTARKRSAADITRLLERDHRVVKRLLNQLDKTTERASKQREELFKQIETELKTHMKIEEQIFYPAFKAAVKKANQDMYFEAREEHHLVDIVLAEMKGSSVESEEWGAKAKVLKDLVLHHAEEEEEPQMFPLARRVMSKQQLSDLAQQMKAKKSESHAGILTRVARTTGATLGRIIPGSKRKAA